MGVRVQSLATLLAQMQTGTAPWDGNLATSTKFKTLTLYHMSVSLTGFNSTCAPRQTHVHAPWGFAGLGKNR